MDKQRPRPWSLCLATPKGWGLPLSGGTSGSQMWDFPFPSYEAQPRVEVSEGQLSGQGRRRLLAFTLGSRSASIRGMRPMV